MTSDDVSRLNVMAEIQRDIKELRTEIRVIQNDIEHMKRDIGFLHDWNIWLLLIAVFALAMPKFVEGIKSLLGAVTDVISAVAKAFRKENKA